MEDFKKLKKKISKLKDTEQINDLLIEVSKNPSQNTLNLIDYLLQKLDHAQVNKIKLNLVYLIGEVSKTINLEANYINFLIDTYYESDRWIRNEIIQSLYKICKSGTFNQSILLLLEIGLKEDYLPIQENSLRTLLLYNNIDDSTIKAIILLIDPKKPDLSKLGLETLKKTIKDEIDLFRFLDHNQNYKMLNKEKIRMLLIEYFFTVPQLEEFNKKIIKSVWDNTIKETFSSEIKSLERLLLSNK